MLAESFIFINGAHFYAYHGVEELERAVGGSFTVSVRVGYDVSKALATDNVGDTISYARVYKTVSHEMAIPSCLLEHVAGRIEKALKAEFPDITSLSLRIMKDNPPMGAQCGGAGVDVTYRYEGQKVCS